ncbi:MAG TPA: hypothetical protein DD638_11335, partial [Pasteurellaceae bacterium]|nr:hypothetical protein [Pasteurellaceae bacterium]
EDSIEISAEPTKEGAEDYKRLMQWEEVQEQKLGELGIKIQQQVQEAMTTKAIPAGLEDNIKQYKASLEEVNKSLENLSIDDPEIKALAAKKRELYSFSGEGLLLSVNVMTSEDQSPEFIQKFEKQIGELSNKVNQLNTHIGKAEAALDKKYPRQ